MALQWEVTEHRPKDIRGLSDDLITVARQAAEDGKNRRLPHNDETDKAVKTIKRYVSQFIPGKSVRSRVRDGVIIWWVTDKVQRAPGTKKAGGTTQAATQQGQNGGAAKKAGTPLQAAAAAVQKGR